MKLYVYPVAPNPTKVRLYLAEKRAAGVKLNVEEVSVDLRRGEQKSEAHLARNPFGKLPVLELDDGTHVIESLAIMEYLEELHPQPSFMGVTPAERARVRELERIADFGVLIPIGGIVHATRSPLGLPPDPAVAELLRPRLGQALEILDARMSDGRRFVAGDNVSIADCTLAAALQFGRFGKIPLPPQLTRLQHWVQSYNERPAARAVLSL